MQDDSIAALAGASLVGALTVGEPEYFDDGRVEVVKSVQIERVLETIRRKTKEKLRADGSTETVAFDEKIELGTEGKTLEAMGNSAIPGSLGHQKIMAKRAAELDAYRRLAARILQRFSGFASDNCRQLFAARFDQVARLVQDGAALDSGCGSPRRLCIPSSLDGGRDGRSVSEVEVANGPSIMRADHRNRLAGFHYLAPDQGPYPARIELR
jgi:hypothetical protein